METTGKTSPRLIDTHCHLDLEDFDPDRAEVIQRAREAGVVQMITIGIDPDSSARAVRLAQEHDFIRATVGHHPHEAQALKDRDLVRLRDLARHEGVVGFGEIGLDFYRDRSPRRVQRRRFDDLLHLGLELGLPLIIHDRDAHQEVLEQITVAGGGRNGGVIHCFSGDYDLARRFIDLGFHVSIPGTVTYKKAEVVREVARRLPLDVLLVETDAPFLAPAPFRGRRNEPALVRYTAEEVARIKGVGFEEAAAAFTANARALFGLPEAG
ncbi:MAG: TatD family hydrolase [Thermodesulfobacteriota bacterium]